LSGTCNTLGHTIPHIERLGEYINAKTAKNTDSSLALEDDHQKDATLRLQELFGINITTV